MVRRVSQLMWPALLLPAAVAILWAPAASAQQAASKTPVIFGPVRLPRGFAQYESALKQALAASLLGTGKYSEALSSENAKTVMECVREVNSDVNREQCWVRAGLGVGAELMADGVVQGTKKSCTVSVKLTVLETRVSTQRTFRMLKPCGLEDLVAEMTRAANELAGTASPKRALVSGGSPPALPPPVVSTPTVTGGSATVPTANLAIEIKPYEQTRLDLTDPSGKSFAVASPYRNPRAAVGTWQVKARATGRETLEQSLAVPPDDTTLLQHTLRPLGAMVVTGTPAGAAIQVTGPNGFADQRGLPWEARGLAIGEYRIRVTRKGYLPFEETHAVRSGETTRVPVKLARAGKGRRDPKGLTWIRLPGGSFQMGSNSGAKNEKPPHRVRVKPFEIGKTEVTLAQYRACVKAGACTDHHLEGYEWPGQEYTPSEYCNWGHNDRGDHPMNCVDWSQAQAFARWARARLCTEAEWEYAARSGGRDRKYPWGSQDATCERAVMKDGGHGCGKKRTWPGCSKKAGNSEQGVCDLAGNVWEWVQDWYHDSYAGAPDDGKARENPTGSKRVYRGGSWNVPAGNLRAAFRYGNSPGLRGGGLGIRVCRQVAP